MTFINSQLRHSRPCEIHFCPSFISTSLDLGQFEHNYVYVWRVSQFSLHRGKMCSTQWDPRLGIVVMAEIVFSTSCGSYQKRSQKAARSTFQYVRPHSI